MIIAPQQPNVVWSGLRKKFATGFNVTIAGNSFSALSGWTVPPSLDGTFAFTFDAPTIAALNSSGGWGFGTLTTPVIWAGKQNAGTVTDDNSNTYPLVLLFGLACLGFSILRTVYTADIPPDIEPRKCKETLPIFQPVLLWQASSLGTLFWSDATNQPLKIGQAINLRSPAADGDNVTSTGGTFAIISLIP